ncbi:MAG TPA: DUF2182 domain-containing protein [Candidatus Angelobacter sp.]|nr:DUF2182 domain-containing protein [Candidatus Angelobacter sp.]
MTPAARERSQIRLPMLCISAAAWMTLAANGTSSALHSHNAAMADGMPLSGTSGLLLPDGLSSRVAGWALMLVAMMAPLLIAPVRHVRDSSFARRRARVITLFVAGYGAVWMAAGFTLLELERAGKLITRGAPSLGWLLFGVAIVWQFSPFKQRCLNRGHAHPELAAFGLAADYAAWRFGLTHALWCAGSCWALMLLPLAFGSGHLIVMFAVTLWLLAERLERPEPPRWRWRGPATAFKLALAQAPVLLGSK